jgi:sialidase-1
VVSTTAAPTGSISPARPFRMYAGQRLDGANRFLGQLDEVRLYKRALSAAEIAGIRATNAVDVPGAVLRLPFMTNGPRTPDTSGAGNTGFVRGGATLTTGAFGGALAFDGVDDAVQVPFSRSLDLAGGEFTVTAWFRYTRQTGRHALAWAYGQGSAVAQLWLRAHPAENRVLAWAESDTAAASTASTAAYGDGAWHHVVLQRAAGQLRLLVDGVLVGSAAVPAGSLTAGHPDAILGLHLGQRPDGMDRLAGALDEVRVFNRALSADELDRIRLENAAVTDGLVLRLPLDRVDPA